MSRLEIAALEVSLGGRRLLGPLDLALGPGELLGFIGPNGAGKSTALRAIAQLLPYRGQIRLDGQPLAGLDPRARARRLAYLGQADRVEWAMRARDLVALGRYPWQGVAGEGEARYAEAIERAMRAADVWGLRERPLDRLSGGERARVRLARALAVEAPLLLADEPVAAADPCHQLGIMELLRAQCAEGRSVILVLHDLTLASRFCDRLLLLDRGAPVASGLPAEVLSAERLRAVYGIEALVGGEAGRPYVIPWSRVPLFAVETAQKPLSLEGDGLG
ncbi:MAG: ABC transporter ATP-binding protein [Chromatiaceae bacterium]|nr:ABC transporter ATP-binding protein [Chromatiaceae bacterium]